MKRKRRLLPVLLLALAMALSACGGNNAGNNAAEPPTNAPTNQAGSNAGAGENVENEPQEPVTLRMLWWGAQTRHDNTLKIIDLYEAQNPHVSIEPEFTGFDGYWEKLSAMVAGNNAPDVLQMNFGEYLTQYAQNDVLADLNEFVDSGIIDTSKLDEGTARSTASCSAFRSA